MEYQKLSRMIQTRRVFKVGIFYNVEYDILHFIRCLRMFCGKHREVYSYMQWADNKMNEYFSHTMVFKGLWVNKSQ